MPDLCDFISIVFLFKCSERSVVMCYYLLSEKNGALNYEISFVKFVWTIALKQTGPHIESPVNISNSIFMIESFSIMVGTSEKAFHSSKYLEFIGSWMSCGLRLT